MTRGSRAGTPLVSRISRLAYAARAKSVRFDLALIVFAGRLRDDQHSRLASPISTTKVETVHPQVFEVYVWVPPIFSYVLIVNEITDYINA